MFIKTKDANGNPIMFNTDSVTYFYTDPRLNSIEVNFVNRDRIYIDYMSLDELAKILDKK